MKESSNDISTLLSLDKQIDLKEAENIFYQHTYWYFKIFFMLISWVSALIFAAEW